MFGMYPQKGVIAPGSDADIVLYDPAASWTISVDNHHMNMDHSAWEGFKIQGKVDTVMSRGRVILEAGNYLGSPGDGKYQRRGLSSYLI
jgi:dihydropyrimidinase